MGGGLDAKHFVHLPGWAKILCLTALGLGIAASVATMAAYFGSDDNRDWVVIGISGVQFLITTFVIAVVLFTSETDANIETLQTRTATFLTRTLPEALARITLDEAEPVSFRVTVGERRDIFGHDFALYRGPELVMRLWCGVNVSRIIVIYRFTDVRAPAPPHVAGRLSRALGLAPGGAEAPFVDRLRTLLRFSFGGAVSVGYNPPHLEPTPSFPGTVSAWLTAKVQDDFLTNPAAKLFWAQDVAMMTESILRTALRHQDEVRLDTITLPRPQ